MKRILVMSDTHGNHSYLRHVCLSEKYDVLIHLGDDYSDLDNHFDFTDSKQVFRVPGIMNNVALSDNAPMILHIIIDDWRFQLVHREEDSECISPRDDVILYGHTHHPVHHFHNGVLYANPGHLKSSHHRNHDASYLMITLNAEKIELEWKDPQGNTFDEYTILRTDLH